MKSKKTLVLAASILTLTLSAFPHHAAASTGSAPPASGLRHPEGWWHCSRLHHVFSYCRHSVFGAAALGALHQSQLNACRLTMLQVQLFHA